MRTTLALQARPQPSVRGWEAYRSAAMAIVELETRARERAVRTSDREAHDAKHGN